MQAYSNIYNSITSKIKDKVAWFHGWVLPQTVDFMACIDY